MIPDRWRAGEVAVVGLGRSGVAVTRFLAGHGLMVYASDHSECAMVREAAAALAGGTVSVEVGRHDLDRIRKASVVITSPGVPPTAPPLAAARAAQREILAELDVAAQFLDDVRLIVVTGTNGKTTTTTLIAHLLAAGGIPTLAAGNIGLPLIELASAEQRPQWVAVEASSFQLHDAPHLVPDVGVLTNLSPDHLDRYASAAEYYDDKRKLFKNASAASVWVLNADDSAVIELAGDVCGVRRLWSTERRADAWYDREASCLRIEDTALVERHELKLLGDHNVANGLAAALAVAAAGVSVESLSNGLRSFRALSHRLEPIREVHGVLWINDSKATNVSSTTVALLAMHRPFVLIAGGHPKGDSYTPLAQYLRPKCIGVVAYGDAARAIERELKDTAPVYVVEQFAAAVARAREVAPDGSAVLLSPACASFDQFASYEARGEAFRRLVEAL